MNNFPCSSPASLCDQQTNPLTAYSSEVGDSPTFLSAKWSDTLPLLNKNFNSYPCVAFAQSQTSQEEADRAALRGALACTNPCSELFSNTSQTATAFCSNGGVSSFTVPAGEFTALDQLTADRKAFTVALQTITAHQICLGSLFGGTMCLGSFFEAELFASGNDAPFQFEIIQGSLPPGIVMSSNSTSAVFMGVPTQTGAFNFTVRARNTAGVTSTHTATITVVTITSSSTLPDAFLNTPYSVALTLINPNSDPVVWTITSGSLPPGLSLNADTGVISGSPSAGGGLTPFTVEASVDGGACTKNFVINAQLINWDLTVWSLIQVVPGGGGGSASGSFLGRDFSVSGKGNGSPSAKVEGLGTLTYTGPAVNCKITITVTSQGTSAAGLIIRQDGVQKLLVNSGLTVGVHVLPFSLIAGVASSITIVGLVDIADPARLFIFDSNSVLWAWSARLDQV